MNEIVKSAWANDPPRVYVISQPLPNAPHVTLSGGGCSSASIEEYLKSLQRDFENQTGKYFAYVMKGDREEADTFILKTWDVYTSPTSCYEALVHLYYAPLNEYLCLKKDFGEYWAQKYLDDIKARDMAIAAISSAFEKNSQ